MWRGLWRSFIALASWAAAALAILYIAYHFIDPLPPRNFAIAAGIPGSPYDNFVRQYAARLTRDGTKLDIRNTASTLENLDLLRDGSSGVQAALTTFGFTQPADTESLYSLGGVFDAVIFIFYRSSEPITHLANFRGKRLSIGPPGSALRSLMSDVLKASGVLDGSSQLSDLDYSEALDALIAGGIDMVAFPSQLDGTLLQRALNAPEARLMDVTQSEAIAKKIPGLKHVVLWQGLISLNRNIPASGVNLLAFRSRVLVRRDLHPALQYLLLEAMREVHWAPGPFNNLGEFPAEQPNDLPLSPTAQAFYRSGPTFWQQYTSFWLASLLDRIAFFVIPIVALLIPLIGFLPRFYRWLHVRRIDLLHRALGKLENEVAQSESARAVEYQIHIAKIEQAVRSLKVSPSFQVDLYRLRVHLRMVQEDIARWQSPTLK